jgi:RsiW-degrading membrane proteinase PrsW (M82 family)
VEPGDLFTAIVWAIVPAAILLLLIYALDRYEKEPLRLLVVAFLFGAVVAPLVAFLVQRLLDVPTSMAVADVVPESRLNLTTPVVEEVVKGLTVLAVFLLARHEFDSLLDGFVYGAVVGVGFGAAANFVAIMSTQPLIGSTSVDVTPSLFAAMVAGLNQVVYVGIVGLALASARGGSTGKVLVALVVGVLAALGLHLLHDYLPSLLAGDASGATGGGAWLADLPNLIGLVGLGVMIVWATAREGGIVAGQLADEVATGTVLPDEYRVVTNPVKRSGRLLSSLLREGGDVWRARRTLYVQEVELAFRKHHARTGRQPAGTGLDEDEYRRRIAEARGRIEAHAGRAR